MNVITVIKDNLPELMTQGFTFLVGIGVGAAITVLIKERGKK